MKEMIECQLCEFEAQVRYDNISFELLYCPNCGAELVSFDEETDSDEDEYD